MTEEQTIVRLGLIILQMRNERKFIKTKPYSQTLTEELLRDIQQLKLIPDITWQHHGQQ